MSYDEKKKKEQLSEYSSSKGQNSLARTIRRVSPLGMRVLVRIQESEDVTDGGLYLPEGAKQNMAESVIAQVVEVALASDHKTQEETNISGVPLGAKVLIKKNAGVRVSWDDSLRIVETSEVLATVSEIELT